MSKDDKKSMLPVIKKKYSTEYIVAEMLFLLYLVLGILVVGTFGVQQE